MFRELSQYEIHALIVTTLCVLIFICGMCWAFFYRKHHKAMRYANFKGALIQYFEALEPNKVKGARKYILDNMLAYVENDDYMYVFEAEGREKALAKVLKDLDWQFKVVSNNNKEYHRKQLERRFNEIKSKNQGDTPEA